MAAMQNEKRAQFCDNNAESVQNLLISDLRLNLKVSVVSVILNLHKAKKTLDHNSNAKENVTLK